jgi:phage tail sheath protein FI
VPIYHAPDIYVEEVSTGARPIEAVGTSTAAFLGVAPLAAAERQRAVDVNSWTQFARLFIGESTEATPLVQAVYGFFQNGGKRCWIVAVGKDEGIAGGGRTRKGIDLLEPIDEVKIVAAPGYTDLASYSDLIKHCENLGTRVAILDGPEEVVSINQLTKVAAAPDPGKPRRGAAAAPPADEGAGGELPGLRAPVSENGFATCYWPWLVVRDPLVPRKDGQDNLVRVPPSGHIAGVWARTDVTRGVHKAPANTAVRGALNLTFPVTRQDQAELNQAGVNCIRMFQREGILVWGGRTLAASASEWRYLNVRRLFNMIEESIALNTRWVVFEPNDFTLWKSIVRDIRAFLTLLWRDGALMGRTPEEAFFVQCDEETNPPEVIDAGMVVTRIGIAPVKPAEFVVFRIGQYAGGSKVETEQGGANA